ncbi:DNA-binding protein SMUBP-2-like [Oratosquilla oratoria]|uniref:DNA-binding protein SMUBP-2-like n=1 Tax=Oratosquilla oratoria TaxID=337810 RepID=UPI003F76548B
MESNISKEKWTNLHLKLLENERQTEVETARAEVDGIPLKVKEAQGVVLGPLVLAERSTGLYGRPLVIFNPRLKGSSFPANKFSSGDIVGIAEAKSSGGSVIVSGVITRISQSSVQVAFDEECQEGLGLEDDDVYRMHKLANEVTYKRIKTALNRLADDDFGSAGHLVAVLFGDADPREIAPSIPPKLKNKDEQLDFFNANLDDSQKAAVSFAIRRSDLAVIHGPPGTGKTTTLIEVIRQHIQLGSKVLACAPSNLAVDNLVERLVAVNVRVVRVGHPARTTPQTHKFTLDALVQASDEAALVADVRKDIDRSLASLRKVKDKGTRNKIRTELKHFRKELRERETKATKQILWSADVVLTTLTSCGGDGPLRLLPKEHFDVTIIDECSQSIEAACYLSIMRSPKLIVAGDHKQLPPTIMSVDAASKGLEKSLMERILDMYGKDVVHMLTVQYRMNNNIMEWASEAMYEGKLVADSLVSSHLLHHMEGVKSTEDTEEALVLVDTAGCDCPEMETLEEQSKGNAGEAAVVAAHVRALLKAGLQGRHIAVITPYNLQVELIRGLLTEEHPEVEVRSVDGFQGREKEAVVLSLVRSNDKGQVGFLSEDRRLNVAVTRARRHVAVICDSTTVGQHGFIKNLLDYIAENGQVRTAHDYQEALDNTEVTKPDHIILKSSEPKAKTDKTKGKGGSSSQRSRPTKEPSVRQKDKKYCQKTLTQEEQEERNVHRRAEFEAQIKEFIFSREIQLVFPPDLNSYERRLVHEIAEEHKLKHESTGEDKARHIVVSKKNVKEERDSNKHKELIEDLAQNIVENHSKHNGPRFQKPSKVTKDEKQKDLIPKDEVGEIQDVVEEDPEKRVCHCCGKDILKQNYDLHVTHCEKRKQQQQSKENQKSEDSSVRKKTKKTKGKDKKQDKEEDFDDLIASFTKKDNTCSMSKCKVATSIIFQQCHFCQKTFCLAHHMAEVHGCGDQARAEARKMIVREGVLYPGSGIPSKKPDPTKRVHLQRKLDKKLEDMEGKRKQKKPGKENEQT